MPLPTTGPSPQAAIPPARPLAPPARPVVPPARPPAPHSAPRPPVSAELGDAIPSASALPYRGRGTPTRALLTALGGSDLCIELQPGKNTVGRHQSNHIVLVSGQVSRFHAEVIVGDEGVVVYDLDSNNGTFVNDRRIERAPLQAGDIVMFTRQFALRLQLDIASQPLTSSVRRNVADLEPFERDSSVAERVPPSLAQEMEASGVLRPPDRPSQPLCIAKRKSVVIEEPILEQSLAATAQPIDPRERRKSVPPISAPRHARRPTESALATVSALEAPHAAIERREAEEHEQRLAVLYELTQQCAQAASLEQLDAMLINVLERVLAFDRGFLLYQLPTGDWRLTTSRAQRWNQQLVRNLMQASLDAVGVLVVEDSRRDARLGTSSQGDARVLVPLSWSEQPIGILFLSSARAPFDAMATSFLGLFADITSQSIVGCVSRLFPA